MGIVTNSLRARLPQVASIPVIIEVLPQFGNQVLAGLTALNITAFYDISLGSLRFLTVDALPVQFVDQVANIPGVEAVHFDFPNQFYGFGIIPFLSAGGRLRDLIIGENVGIRNILTDSQRTPQAGWIGTAQVRKVVKVDMAGQDGVDGSGTKVAVLDTGVFARHLGAPPNVVQDSVSLFGIMKRGDSSGHGTHVAATGGFLAIQGPTGIMTQGMSKAQIISIKTLRTPRGIARDSDVLQGISLAVNTHGAKIINMSLGHTAEELPTVEPICKVITDLSRNQGKIFVVANGNSGPGPGTVESPAHTPEAIAVGSYSMTDRTVSWFSSRGPTLTGAVKPDIIAPGGGRKAENLAPNELIYAPTAYLSSLDRTDNMVGIRPRLAFAALMGTSQAAPVVAFTLADWNDIFKKTKGRELIYTDVFNIFRAKGQARNNNSGHGQFDYTWARGG